MEALAERARLLPMPASKRAMAPLATHWEWPMGTRKGAFSYNAQPFGEKNAARGGLHLGDDLNGIGQENTDLGDPVFAAADGLVVYSGVPSAGWGGVVILLHRTDAGERQTFYGHLEPSSLAVVAGESVPRGRRLGRLGLTEAVDYAHLHWELRPGAVVDPGPGYSADGLQLRENASQFARARSGPLGMAAAMRSNRGGEVKVTSPGPMPE